MTVRIYKNASNTMILTDDPDNPWFPLDVLDAQANGDNIDIVETITGINIYCGCPYTDFVDSGGTVHGVDKAATITALNAIF